MTRSHDVSQLTTAELELTGRQLRANLALITPAPTHTCRSRRTCRQSTPSLPDEPVISSQAQATSATARTVPARPPSQHPAG